MTDEATLSNSASLVESDFEALKKFTSDKNIVAEVNAALNDPEASVERLEEKIPLEILRIALASSPYIPGGEQISGVNMSDNVREEYASLFEEAGKIIGSNFPNFFKNTLMMDLVIRMLKAPERDDDDLERVMNHIARIDSVDRWAVLDGKLHPGNIISIYGNNDDVLLRSYTDVQDLLFIVLRAMTIANEQMNKSFQMKDKGVELMFSEDFDDAVNLRIKGISYEYREFIECTRKYIDLISTSNGKI